MSSVIYISKRRRKDKHCHYDSKEKHHCDCKKTHHCDSKEKHHCDCKKTHHCDSKEKHHCDCKKTHHCDCKEKDHCDCKKDHKSKCKGCICQIIKDFIGKEVFIRTESGDVIDGTILDFDKKTCCVKILSPEMLSPMEPAEKTIISCKDIESITFVVREKVHP